jgi:hypothetical protein
VDFIEDCIKIQREDIEKKQSSHESPFIHFLLEIATNDDKLLEREVIGGENRINKGNHDDYDMIYGDDGKNQNESPQLDGDNQDHEEVNGNI